MAGEFSDDFEKAVQGAAREAGRQAVQQEWEDFCTRMWGAAEADIEAAVVREWGGPIGGDVARAMSRGNRVSRDVALEP